MKDEFWRGLDGWKIYFERAAPNDESIVKKLRLMEDRF